MAKLLECLPSDVHLNASKARYVWLPYRFEGTWASWTGADNGRWMN